VRLGGEEVRVKERKEKVSDRHSSSTSFGCSRATSRDWKDWQPGLHRAIYAVIYGKGAQ